jgi:surface carbohydrate biosynthesis protein
MSRRASSVRPFVLTVETSSRELDARLLVAAAVVQPDRPVVVGQHWVIGLAAAVFGGGVHLGKNFLPVHPDSDYSTLDRFRAAGVSLLHLDEEGALLPGDEDGWRRELGRRLDVTRLRGGERVLTWGTAQRAHYMGRILSGDCRPEVQATGHPRFDLYLQGYGQLFDRVVEGIRTRFAPYILINTNLTVANPDARYPQDLPTFIREFGRQDDRAFLDRWASARAMVGQFIVLARTIAHEMPEVQVVLRSHPSENDRIYRESLSDLANVHVIHEGPVTPWILGAEALVHNACTTAVEATIAGMRTLTFSPYGSNAGFAQGLPDDISIRCASVHAVLSALSSRRERPSGSVTGRHISLIRNLAEPALPHVVSELEKAMAEQSESVPASRMRVRDLRQALEAATRDRRQGVLARLTAARRLPRATKKFPGFPSSTPSRHRFGS